MSRPIVNVAPAACAVLVAIGAFCSEAAAEAASAQAEAKAAGAAYSQITDAPADSETPKPAGGQIAMDEDGARIVMRLGRKWSKPIPKPGEAALAFDTLSLALSAPFGGENADGKNATLDRLAGGTSLEASFSRMVVTRPDRQSGGEILAVCDAVVNEQDLYAATLQARADHEAARGDKGAAAITGVEVGKAQAIAAEAKERLKNGNGCDSDFVALYDPERLDRHERALWGERPTASLYGASLKTSRDVFDYVDPATAAKLSTEKSSWSLKAFYAHRPLNAQWLFLVTAEHQDGYEARDEAITCPPGGVAADCVNGPAGAPKHKVSDQISLEYRRAFGDVSAALAVTYDANDNLFAAELPIYLVRGDDGAFNGGFKLNWRSDTGEVLASVFVGRAFDLGMP